MGYRLDGDMNTCPGKPITTIKVCVHAVYIFFYTITHCTAKNNDMSEMNKWP